MECGHRQTLDGNVMKPRLHEITHCSITTHLSLQPVICRSKTVSVTLEEVAVAALAEAALAAFFGRPVGFFAASFP